MMEYTYNYQIWFQGHYVGGYDQFEQMLSIQNKEGYMSYNGNVELEECSACEA